ncbi:LysR family transcriptional regulator [Alicycliphilus denitrificans]|uniref:LysR family transcriptional regulator n=1 Tax=Alicycliphilus denitrificans TaxID=179636 RepID=A0A858ZZ08_9BURK|nr:LysR family transcriptional regulator [Alicycliphilus denitrificans]ADV01955.1 LysR substrate-binding protein [Alicycliphilus denitrificans BC]QKD46058.1 LysR family transcriptional regulator [Alicycliphilus denitrificans]GAO25559.1 LysR family transcriptional regulator [Alicycliphilus sp. B1]
MNLRQLQHFVVLGEVLNFRKAADKLHIVQPALTASIRRLEIEFGVDLFERTTRDVKLSAAGRAALPEVKRALQQMDRARRNAKATQTGEWGTLRVGFVGSASMALLPAGIRAFRTRFPDVVLGLQESTGSRIVDLIDNGQMDVGLIRTPAVNNRGLTIHTLQTQRFMVVIPRGSEWEPARNTKKVRLQDLANAPFITFSRDESPMLYLAVVSVCREAGFTPNIVQEAIQVQTVVTLVESGLGVGLVPSVCAQHKPANASFFELAKQTPACATGLALVYDAGSLSPVGRRFVQTLSELAEQDGPAPV